MVILRCDNDEDYYEVINIQAMKVCMFVLNNCKRDSRILKEAKTLADAGHDVRIIAVLDKDTEPYEEKDGFRIIRITRISIYPQVLQAILKAEFFAIGLGSSSLDFFRSAFHRTGPASAPPLDQVEQLSTSAPPKAEPLIWLAYRRVRRSLHWALRITLRPFKRPKDIIAQRPFSCLRPYTDSKPGKFLCPELESV